MNGNKYILGSAIVGILLAFLVAHSCYRRKIEKAPLKEGGRKIIIDTRSRTLTIETPEGKQRKHGVRKIVITEDKEGHSSVLAPTWGLTFEPGFSGFVAYGSPNVGLDLQWLYWKQFGLSTGTGIYKKEDESLGISFYPLAINYNLPFLFTPNTNIFVGIDSNYQPIGGFSVKW